MCTCDDTTWAFVELFRGVFFNVYKLQGIYYYNYLHYFYCYKITTSWSLIISEQLKLDLRFNFSDPCKKHTMKECHLGSKLLLQVTKIILVIIQASRPSCIETKRTRSRPSRNLDDLTIAIYMIRQSSILYKLYFQCDM